MRAWKAAKRIVTSSAKSVKNGLIRVKTFSQKKKAVIIAGVCRCSTSVREKVETMPGKAKKLINKIRGNDLS